MIDIIKELLKPRTLFAFVFYLTYCSLLSQGKEIPDHFIAAVAAILGHYFGKSTNKNGGGNDKNINTLS